MDGGSAVETRDDPLKHSAFSVGGTCKSIP
jgi:hypothetical protein